MRVELAIKLDAAGKFEIIAGNFGSRSGYVRPEKLSGIQSQLRSAGATSDGNALVVRSRSETVRSLAQKLQDPLVSRDIILIRTAQSFQCNESVLVGLRSNGELLCQSVE